MSVHYGVSRQEIKDKLTAWKYDYITSTYLLLQKKKLQGRPVRLLRQKVLRQRQLEVERDMCNVSVTFDGIWLKAIHIFNCLLI